MEAGLDHPIPVPRDEDGRIHGYIPSGPPLARIVSNPYLFTSINATVLLYVIL